jgi:hypothetical protein
VLPAVIAGRTTAEEALHDAKEMGARDLREEYSQHQASPPAATPPGGADSNGGGSVEPPSPELSSDQWVPAWRALRDELLSAVASGTPEPRVSADLVGPGLEGLRSLVATADAVPWLEGDLFGE